jgi:hypothetical protein
MDCRQKKNLKRCQSTYLPYPHMGICCECITYYLKMRELPGCFFPDDAEKIWDRSFEHFSRLVQAGRV